MDKSRVCVTKTINLVKAQPCVKKQNLLLFEKTSKASCGEAVVKQAAYLVPPISALPAKTIRVCTGKELKKICPPKLCECEPKKSLGFFGFISKMIGYGLKTAVAAGLVYWSYEIGLWGPPDDTEKLYKDFCHIVTPPVCPDSDLVEGGSSGENKHKPGESEFCKAQQELMCAQKKPNIACESTPHVEGVVHKMKEYWNTGVITIFYILTQFPENINLLISKISGCADGSTPCEKKLKAEVAKKSVSKCPS